MCRAIATAARREDELARKRAERERKKALASLRVLADRRGALVSEIDTASRMLCGSRLPGSCVPSDGVKVKVMCGEANAGAAVPIERAVSVPATARDPRRRLTFIVRDPLL